MKLSVSLPDEDVAYLDAYARGEGLPSRSAALHRAVRLLRSSTLGSEYADAWREWEEGGDARVWENAAADGLTPPAA
jgi:Arc/MetJ-type ribon-helix-helix transcriptional regulator